MEGGRSLTGRESGKYRGNHVLIFEIDLLTR